MFLNIKFPVFCFNIGTFYICRNFYQYIYYDETNKKMVLFSLLVGNNPSNRSDNIQRRHT